MLVLKPKLTKSCGEKQAGSVWNKSFGFEVLDSGLVEPIFLKGYSGNSFKKNANFVIS